MLCLHMLFIITSLFYLQYCHFNTAFIVSITIGRSEHRVVSAEVIKIQTDASHYHQGSIFCFTAHLGLQRTLIPSVSHPVFQLSYPILLI